MPLLDLSQVPGKYLVLAIFVLFTMNNGFAWLVFDPVAETLDHFFKDLNKKQLELLSSWQPIVFLVMCFPVMKLVARYDGLRLAVRLGATSEMLGAVLKLIGCLSRSTAAGLAFLHIGQIFSGVGSPVATGAVSALSATWFEPEERTRATGAAVMMNTMGNAICYLVIPFMTSKLTFTSVIVYEVIMAAIAVGLVWFAMPQEPLSKDSDKKGGRHAESTTVDATNPLPSDLGNGEEVVVTAAHPKAHASIIMQLKKLFSNLSCVCLCVVYAWLCGSFAAWISLFAATYASRLGESFTGFMSFAGTFMYVVGGFISSCVVDLYFARQMKYVIFFCITMNTLSNLIFIACTPNDHGFSLWKLGNGFIVFSTGLCGFWNGAAAPLFYELVAEISFPVEEGVSGICISICENLGALLFYQVISRIFEGQSMSVAYSFGMVVTVALCAAVKQRYNRTYHAFLLENNGAPQEK